MSEQCFARAWRGVCFGVCLFLVVPILFLCVSCRAQVSASHRNRAIQDDPKPAIPAILEAFNTFEVVGMSAAHGQKDVDDFILSLVRDPRFPLRVNDIVVECGNRRYQQVLDRYIAGENIAFTEVEHVWRDTTVQQMCGASAFYEQLYPLVRSLNQHLPASRRLRMVAADPPIEWSQIHSYQDLTPFFDRDGSIASVMETEVLSKHRKALMLFGIFHLLHHGGPGEGDAVARYEREYPGKTFVISSDFGYYDIDHEPPGSVEAAGGVWPSMIRTNASKFGSLGLDAFLQSPITTDRECNVVDAFASTSGTTVADQIDAFLYVGPQGSQMAEPLPADIGLDRTYRTEWLRRMRMVGLPGPSTLEEVDANVVANAANPVYASPRKGPVPEQLKARMRQSCLDNRQVEAK